MLREREGLVEKRYKGFGIGFAIPKEKSKIKATIVGLVLDSCAQQLIHSPVVKSLEFGYYDE